MTRRGSYYTEVTLDGFLPELLPFVSFSHFINRRSRLRHSSYSFQGILIKLSRYCCHEDAHILSRSCSADFYQSYDPLTIVHQLVLSPQLLSQFSVDFSETFQLLFPRPDQDHIIPKSCLTAFTRVMALCQF